MPVMNMSQEKAQKLYQEIVDRLQELWMLSSDQSTHGEDAFDETEILQDYVQELADTGVDEVAAERALRAIAMFRRAAKNSA